jgi:glycosyltransferase involved in cell wall biosynthesis
MVLISVAMATYNGEDYIEEQLQSIASQNRLPDEVVICDDASTDATVGLIDKFARNVPFAIRTYVNGANIGFSRNFNKALSLCEGDIVFLSDQDDVWFADKLSSTLRVFAARSEVCIVVHDAIITDNILRPTDHTRFGQARRAGYGQKEMKQGACTAVRASFLRPLLPIPSSVCNHDVWMHTVGDLLGCKLVFEVPLQYFRRHKRNSSDPLISSIREVSKSRIWCRRFRQRILRGRRARQDVEERLRMCLFLLFWWERNLKGIPLYCINHANIESEMASLTAEALTLQLRLFNLEKGALRRLMGLLSLYGAAGSSAYGGSKTLVKDLLFP